MQTFSAFLRSEGGRLFSRLEPQLYQSNLKDIFTLSALPGASCVRNPAAHSLFSLHLYYICGEGVVFDYALVSIFIILLTVGAKFVSPAHPDETYGVTTGALSRFTVRRKRCRDKA